MKAWTKKHGIKLKYRQRGRRRTYHPDILVEMHDGSKVLEEVKGRVWDRLSFGMKNLAALYFCTMRGWRFRIIFEQQLDAVD